MKILLTFATLLFAATVNATPIVGDYSNFAMTMTQNGTTYTGTYEISLTSARTDGFMMATVITFSGQSAQRSESVVATDDLLNDATIASVLSNCPQYGGQTQQITVPAGSYASCAIPNDDGTTWVASVPFGIVKQTQKQSNGADVVLELQSFTARK